MKCVHCDDGMMSEELFVRALKEGKRNYDVEGLKRYRCRKCGGKYTNRQQLVENNSKIEASRQQVVARP